jgi:2-polyprenyl-3-methyl-5-hydroxy-6-metoxy-1,4-benzoquinol methylase
MIDRTSFIQNIQKPADFVSDNDQIEMISRPRPYSFVREWYDQSAESHFWFKWRLAAALEQIKQAKVPLDHPYRALEVGCGIGILRDQIESATGWIIDATELDIEALEQVKPGRGRRMYYDIFDQKESLLGAYDLLILFDVLEHIEDTQSFLTVLLRHLKSQGLLFINVPALQSCYSHYDELVGHVRRYNKKTLAAEFAAYNVQIEDMRYWGISLVPVLALRKLAMRLMAKQTTSQKIRYGLQPPHALVKNLFLGLMHVETSLLNRPPIGSSLLMIIRKL